MLQRQTSGTVTVERSVHRQSTMSPCGVVDAKGIVDAVDLMATVAAACRGVQGLQAAIVFGSALDHSDPGDLDLALLWQDDLQPSARCERAERVAADLEHALRTRDLGVDVKDLRSLPLAIQHRVLRDGRHAYVADRRALVRFISETVPRALDFLPFYRRALLAAARRLGGE